MVEGRSCRARFLNCRRLRLSIGHGSRRVARQCAAKFVRPTVKTCCCIHIDQHRHKIDSDYCGLKRERRAVMGGGRAEIDLRAIASALLDCVAPDNYI